MKKILLTLTGVIVTLCTMAQSPFLMNYQGVARNAAGNVLPNQNIALRLSVVSGSPTGTEVYSETRTMLTNAFGLFNAVLGSPGATNVTGTIAGINWTAFGAGSGAKYLKVEIDPTGGSSFVNVGSTQMVSVPYALNAGSAAPVGPAGGDLSGSYPNPTVVKLQGRNVAATAPANQNLLMWDATAVSWLPATAAQAGLVSGTGTLNYVPKWTPNGTTIGNSQLFDNGTNVGLNTTNPIDKFQINPAGAGGVTVSTNPASGGFTGMYMGISQQSGGYGVLQGIKASGSTWGDVVINANGGNVGVGIAAPTARLHTITGSGSAGLFQNTVPGNDVDALAATTVTTGTVSSAMHGSAGSSGITVTAKKGAWGESDAGVGVYGTSSTGNGIMGTTNTGATGVNGFSFGTGSGVSGSSLGGRAADFSLAAGNNSTVLNAASGGNGTVVNATTSGTGITALLNNSNTANASNTLRITNSNTSAVAFGNASAYIQRGTPSPVNNYLYTGIPSAGIGIVDAGIGLQGSSSSAFGVAGLTNNGAALVGFAANAAGYGIATTGRLQFSGQGAATGRILGATTNNGDATWQTPAMLGIVSGTGTLNYVPKWTPDGTTIGNSQLFDNGTNIGFATTSPNARFDINNGDASTRGQQVVNTNTANSSAAIFAQSNNTTWSSVLESSAITGLFPVSVGTSVIAGVSAVKGVASTNAAVSQFSGIGVQGASASGLGVVGISTSGTGVLAFNTGSGYGLQTFGKVQIQGQGAAAGRILGSDAVGNATWNTPASLNIVSGNGTLNYMTKWSPDGNTIANSQVFDDGNNVGIGTTTPGAGLTVSGTGIWKSAIGIQNTTSGMEWRMNVQNTAFQITKIPGSTFTPFQLFSTGGMDFSNSAGTSIARLLDNGNVGIGTIAPVAKLSVDNLAAGQGGLRVNQTTELTIPAVKSLSGGVAGGDASANFPANLGANSVYAQRGDFNTGTVTSSALVESGAIGFSPTGTGVQGLSVSGRGVFAGSTNGVGLRAFSQTGQAINSSGAIQLTGIGETNGAILTSDAAGNATWQENTAQSIGISGHYLTGNLVVPNSGLFTPITTWTNLTEDGGANYNPGTGVYTITKTGVYQVNAGVLFDPLTANASQTWINLEVNGSTLHAGSNNNIAAGNYAQPQFSIAQRFTAGTTLRITVGQNSGVNQTISANYFSNHFSIQFLHK